MAAAFLAVFAAVAQGCLAAEAAASGPAASYWIYYGTSAAAMIGAFGINIMTAPVARVPQLAEDAHSGAHQHHGQGWQQVGDCPCLLRVSPVVGSELCASVGLGRKPDTDWAVEAGRRTLAW